MSAGNGTFSTSKEKKQGQVGCRIYSEKPATTPQQSVLSGEQGKKISQEVVNILKGKFFTTSSNQFSQKTTFKYIK